MFQIRFGKFISSLRKEKDLTQDELAEKLNISSGKVISKWENGNMIPDFETIIHLSKELDISLYELSVCEKIKNKSISKEEILRIIDKEHLKKISLKKKIKFTLKFIILVISLIAIIYTATNFNTTKVYTLESQNKDYYINGIYTKTKDYSVFALTEIEYIGNDKKILYSQIKNYNYELFSNKRMIYDYALTKYTDNKLETSFMQSLSNTSILIDNKTDSANYYNNLSDLTLSINYINTNENNKSYQIKIPIRLIEQTNNNKMW